MVLLFLLLLAVPSYGEIAAATNFKTFAREQLTFQDLNSWQTANTAKLNELLAVANSDSLKSDVGGVDTLTTKTAANAAIILNKAIKSKDPQDSIMAFNARLDTARVSRMLLGTSNIATLPMVGFPISASAGTRVSLGSLVAVDSLRIRDSLTVAAGARAYLPRSRIDTLLIGSATPAVGWALVATAGQRATFGSQVVIDTLGISTQQLVVNSSSVRSANAPAFLVLNSAQDDNVTGSTITATVDFDSEVFDQGGNFATDTFTAPVTGRYLLIASLQYSGQVDASAVVLRFVTSNRTYIVYNENFGVSTPSTTMVVAGSVIADMDAGDTATITLDVDGEAGGDIIDIAGGANNTYFSGTMVQ